MSAPDLAKAQQHFEHALLERQKGKLELAVAHFREARRHYPAAPVAGQLGILLSELGRFDEAIAEFSAAVAADPADAGAYFRLGMLLAGQNRNAEATAAYESFIAHCTPEMRGHLDFARARVAALREVPPESPATQPAVPAAPAKPMTPAAPEPGAAGDPPAPEPAAAPPAPIPPARAALRRTLAAAAAAVALAWGAREYGGAALQRYQRWRWPAGARPDATLAGPLARDNAVRRLAEAVHVYRRVATALTAAEAKGQDVSALRGRLKEAEGLMRAGELAQAKALLNIVELRVPRPGAMVTVAEKDDKDLSAIVKDRKAARPSARHTKRR